MGEYLDILQKGGPLALIVAVWLTIKYGAEGLSVLRKSKTEGVSAKTADAATTNALLLASLQAERDESARKDERIGELESENAELRDRNYEQARKYEAELAEVRRKLNDMTMQVDELLRQASSQKTEGRA